MNAEQIEEIKKFIVDNDNDFGRDKISLLYNDSESNEDKNTPAKVLPDTKHFMLTYYDISERVKADRYLMHDSAFKYIFESLFTSGIEVFEENNDYIVETTKMCCIDRLDQYAIQPLVPNPQEKYTKEEYKEAIAIFYYYIVNSLRKFVKTDKMPTVYCKVLDEDTLCPYYPIDVDPRMFPDNVKQYVAKQADSLEMRVRKLVGPDIYNQVKNQHAPPETTLETTEEVQVVPHNFGEATRCL
jgi:hypothetical protein